MHGISNLSRCIFASRIPRIVEKVRRRIEKGARKSKEGDGKMELQGIAPVKE